MKREIIIGLVVSLVVLLLLFITLRRFYFKRPAESQFISRWREVQQLCADQSTWPDAVLEADRLLGLALKKQRLKGKRLGERLVAAQSMLTNKDSVWFGHNLSKKIVEEHGDLKLQQDEVKQALIGFRQALKDLGAFGRDQVEKS